MITPMSFFYCTRKNKEECVIHARPFRTTDYNYVAAAVGLGTSLARASVLYGTSTYLGPIEILNG